MSASEKHADWKTPVIKCHVSHDSVYSKCPEYVNPETESRLVVARGLEEKVMGSDY